MSNQNRAEYYKQWAKNNPEKLAEYHERYDAKFPIRRLFDQARARAKIKNLECTMDIKDLVVPVVCPILGISLIRKPRRKGGVRGGNSNSYSLDRIDNTKG